MKNRLPALTLLANIALVSCSRPTPPKSAGMPINAVATVGTTAIPVEDFIAHAVSRQVSTDPAARKLALDELINEEALAEQARKQGMDQTPAYRRAIRQLLISQLEEKNLQPQLVSAEQVSDADLKTAISAAKEAAPPAEMARCYAWMVFKFSPADRAEGLGRIQAAAAKIKENPHEITASGFGKLAAEFSEDTDTRYQGGVLGWFTAKQLPTRFPAAMAAAAASLPTGQVSEPQNLPDGACLLLATAERQPAPSVQSNPDLVRYQLVQTRQKQLRETFRTTARSQVEVKINQTALQDAVLPEKDNTSQNPPNAP